MKSIAYIIGIILLLIIFVFGNQSIDNFSNFRDIQSVDNIFTPSFSVPSTIPFNGMSLDLDKPIPGYTPNIEPGIVVFDNNNVMCLVSRVLKYDSQIMFSYQTKYHGSGVDYFDWNTFNLLELFDTRLPRADPYNMFTNSDTIVFDAENNVYIVYNNRYLVKFDYLKQTILDIIEFQFDIRIEVKSMTNTYLYNGKPIILSEGPSVSLWESGYQTFKQDAKFSLKPSAIVSTVTHSGKYNNAYTFSGHTYFVFATFHEPGIQDSQGMPNWIVYFDHTTKKWSDAVLLGIIGKYKDWHNGPSLTITSKGQIYVFFGNHLEPIYYTHTRVSQDTSSFVSPIRFPKVPGEGGNSKWYTYPGVRIDNQDNIHITYRGPWYAFTYFKLTTNNNRISYKTLITMKNIKTLDGVTLSNAGYRAYRSAMNLDHQGNVYILISPRVHGTWEAPPYSKTGSFILFSKAGQIDFSKILSLTRLEPVIKERLEKERLEQERLEKERLERERLEKERLELERLELERLEKERLEKERLEKERLEKERLEKERLEKERLEQERLEQITQNLEKERIEKERLDKINRGEYISIDLYGKSGNEKVTININEKEIETFVMGINGYKKKVACSIGDTVSINFHNDNFNNDVFIRTLVYSPESSNWNLTNNIIPDSFDERQQNFIKMGRLYWGALYRFTVKSPLPNNLVLSLSGKSGKERVLLYKNNVLLKDLILNQTFTEEYHFKESDILSIRFTNDNWWNDVYLKKMTYNDTDISQNIIPDKFNDRQLGYIKNGMLLWSGVYNYIVK